MEAADHGKRRACESCRVGAPENVRYVRTVSGATLLACICPEHTQQTPPLIQLQNGHHFKTTGSGGLQAKSPRFTLCSIQFQATIVLIRVRCLVSNTMSPR
ncbi:hypothetical protein BFJ67_g17076 [Fusarium oxysporum f. sp. cepae]|nr:hypothetical protein BFJ67_g17076 [Fusarium oxysporum f. sp. cepae]